MKNAVTFTLKNAMHPLTEVFHTQQAMSIEEAKVEVNKLIAQFKVVVAGKPAEVEAICSIMSS